ncbi:hypothetical protein AB0B50_10175 [Streptomyces sp. NPDC041068]|uniref:hypothetical protein n=1 Tax=Streptomyces sp. NPDC041068 TaxID=3155130 RepID=UPI0034068365
MSQASTPRKRLATVAGVLAGVAMVAVPLTATTASAATASETMASETMASSESPAPRAQGMKFYDDYWTLKECKAVGKWGLNHGKWSVYYCQEDVWDWDLYYDK